MTPFTYISGEEVRAGDQVRYHGEPATIEFVATEKIGDPALDWYIDRFPGGGFMINAKSMGRVFVTDRDADEDLELVSRR